MRMGPHGPGRRSRPLTSGRRLPMRRRKTKRIRPKGNSFPGSGARGCLYNLGGPRKGASPMPARVHAIFEPRHVPGDEAQFRLAQERFAAAGLGAEFYPHDPDELARQLAFRPGPGPITIHLPRNINLGQPKPRDLVAAFAEQFARDAYGLVVHDHPDVVSRFDDYVAAVQEVNAELCRLGAGPMLFIEYAAGIPVEAFVALFEAIRDCTR